jgi:hypothetical protein
MSEENKANANDLLEEQTEIQKAKRKKIKKVAVGIVSAAALAAAYVTGKWIGGLLNKKEYSGVAVTWNNEFEKDHFETCFHSYVANEEYMTDGFFKTTAPTFEINLVVGNEEKPKPTEVQPINNVPYEYYDDSDMFFETKEKEVHLKFKEDGITKELKSTFKDV